jgi:hypothetical protein
MQWSVRAEGSSKHGYKKQEQEKRTAETYCFNFSETFSALYYLHIYLRSLCAFIYVRLSPDVYIDGFLLPGFTRVMPLCVV